MTMPLGSLMNKMVGDGDSNPCGNGLPVHEIVGLNFKTKPMPLRRQSREVGPP
jgi:hypothetical protein